MTRTIDGDVLKSLRMRYKASLDVAGKLTGTDPSVLDDLERNGGSISLTDAKRIAKGYKSHWSVLLSARPVSKIKQPANHRAGYADDAVFSPDTLRAYELAQRLLDISSEIEGQTVNEELLKLRHELSPQPDPIEVANQVRRILGVKTSDIIELKSDSQVYAYWRDVIADNGIYVSEQDMPDTETKAFLMEDGDRAVIVVSKTDKYAYSRVFSILHELGHFVRGEKSAACDVKMAQRVNPSETWCNRFASQMAVPDSEVLADPDSQIDATQDPLAVIKKLSNRYGTSLTVMLYKLKNNNRLSDTQFNGVKSLLEALVSSKMHPKYDSKKEIKLGRQYHLRVEVNRASRSLSREVIERQMTGSLSTGEAASLLGTKAKYLQDIKQMVGFGS